MKDEVGLGTDAWDKPAILAVNERMEVSEREGDGWMSCTKSGGNLVAMRSSQREPGRSSRGKVKD